MPGRLGVICGELASRRDGLYEMRRHANANPDAVLYDSDTIIVIQTNKGVIWPF
jgi:hypothetical protein